MSEPNNEPEPQPEPSPADVSQWDGTSWGPPIDADSDPTVWL